MTSTIINLVNPSHSILIAITAALGMYPGSEIIQS
jgi:hypothetical protein